MMLIFFRHILSPNDSSNLQYAVDALHKWSRKWLLNLNIKNATLFPMGDALRNYTPTVFVTAVIIWFLYGDEMKC